MVSVRTKLDSSTLNKATEAVEAALAVHDVPSEKLLTEYANFLFATGKHKQAYDYLIRVIASGNKKAILQYNLGARTTVAPVLQERIDQEKLVEVRVVDYAFYMLLYHYKDFEQAGITPTQSREAYLAAYAQGVKARSGQSGEEKLDVLARYLLDNAEKVLTKQT